MLEGNTLRGQTATIWNAIIASRFSLVLLRILEVPVVNEYKTRIEQHHRTEPQLKAERFKYNHIRVNDSEKYYRTRYYTYNILTWFTFDWQQCLKYVKTAGIKINRSLQITETTNRARLQDHWSPRR